jgi:hypothetical protein
MAKLNADSRTKAVKKSTSQGGTSPKTSSMSKSQKRSYKAYRGQGK